MRMLDEAMPTPGARSLGLNDTHKQVLGEATPCIPHLVSIVASGNAATLTRACMMLEAMSESEACRQAIAAAGGAEVLLRQLQSSSAPARHDGGFLKRQVAQTLANVARDEQGAHCEARAGRILDAGGALAPPALRIIAALPSCSRKCPASEQ